MTGTIIIISNNIVNIASDTSNKENIINEFLNNWYQNWTGALTWNISGVYIGSKRISTQSSSGEILIPFILQSSGAENKIEIEVPAGITIKKQDWSPFTGILNLPIIQPTGIATWVPNVLSVADFENNQNIPIYFKDLAENPVKIQIRIPVSWATIGDIVNVYYSHDGSTWRASPPTNVININGQTYVSIPSTHLTMFAIGVDTWSFVINNDAISTNNSTVTLNMNISWVQNMRFSNTGESWPRSIREPYFTTKVWTLSTGHEIKTVRVQFDTDGDTGTSEAYTNDNIDYTSKIGFSYCDYGNTLNIGTTWYSKLFREINSPFITISWNTAWFCNDSQGANPRTLNIETSNLINVTTNNPEHTISGNNVYIKNPVATTIEWTCTANSWASLNSRTSIGTSTVIFGKSEGTWMACKIETSQIDIPAYQALGQYSGALIITLPNL